MAAAASLHADRGNGRTYTAADRCRRGETSTAGGLTDGCLKLHPNLHLLDGRDLLKPEYAMCPPQGSQISYAQMVLVIVAYLKNHPEQLDKNFHMLAALALNTAWPCAKAPAMR